ncbi:helix-turn-helix domain-containing protein [Streptomyces sp. AC512_CC834]|uniref:helix-turn-helix domain-containing protein n=1 Tax=Streptomyces sp. AC512_CC834 TaxID=2823691 RepID=UPI0020B69C77|nr:helix-turn-helix domain-containing protein [Streptomyces sp. AC512_CC834]
MIPAVQRDHAVRTEGRVYGPEQEKREQLRLEAAERFERGDEATVIAADLRVTERTVRRWRKVRCEFIATSGAGRPPMFGGAG